MKLFHFVFGVYLVLALVAGSFVYWLSTEPEYAYMPSPNTILAPQQTAHPVKAADIGDTSDVRLGLETFSTSTFGNEVFFTDIMGAFDGPLTLANITKAVIGLRGQGTTNLKVKAAKTATFGGQTIHEGELIETGLDVPKGAYIPLGIRVKVADGRAKAGISCLVCHATVDEKTGKIAMGMPNTDLNIGYMLAMATNTASYFTHTDIKNLKDYLTDLSRTVEGANGTTQVLPNPDLLEEAVDRAVLKWPRGSNDTTLDSENNPVQIPDSVTIGDHPYGWSGQGIAGPFKGLTAAINNAHAQNMDAVSQSEISGPVKEVDKEVYLGTLLQRAATPKYRFDPASKKKPSEFFAAVDPTPGIPGVNKLIPTPSFPKSSYMSAVGLFNSEPGYDAWRQTNAMSAWMNTLNPPASRYGKPDSGTAALGKEVFRRAQCVSCHAGPYFTSNRILSAQEIGTEPSRAAGFQVAERFFDPVPKMYGAGTPVPLPASPSVQEVPLNEEDRASLQLAWAQKGSSGGYKVPSLWGLSWTAPFLHDGGVAVGPDASKDFGIPGTWNKGIRPDPYNSLRALVDRGLREQVVQANKTMQGVRVTGEGHAYWADEASGFTRQEQDALIRYLLAIPQSQPEEGASP